MRKFLKAVFTSSETRTRRAEEAYLNEATSIHDLEWRMAQIDRGLFRATGSFA